jgi:tRNA(fMet)-specific endonuclease VapC
MKYFLDTNICIYYLKGMYPKLKDKLLSYNPDRIIIPVITKAELLYGAEKSQKKEENLKRIQQFLLPVHIQEFSDIETQAYATIRNTLEMSFLITEL